MDESEYIKLPVPAKLPEWLAVLGAAGIEYKLLQENENLVINVVGEETACRARHEIDAYEADELQRSRFDTEGFDRDDVVWRTWSPGWVAAFLIWFYAWLGPYEGGNVILRRAALDVEGIRQGEWWRLVTALTVHADLEHLVGNVLALLFFGWFACRIFGGGLGWVMILTAGIAGNALAVCFQDAGTVSFGASTACFGALGVISAVRIIDNIRLHGIRLSLWNRTWLPLGAGLAMVAMLGTGPRSNIAAHLLGFGCGVGVGLAFDAIGTAWLRAWSQCALQMLCLLVVLGAWWIVIYRISDF